jgi:hypothetical protein
VSVHRNPGPIALLEVILRGTPSLPKALCRKQYRLFDADDPDQIERENQQREALRLCSRCPELQKCRDYVDTLPTSQRPHGVVAGVLLPATKGAA